LSDKEVEVWRWTENLSENKRREAKAWFNLPALQSPTARYDATYHADASLPAELYQAGFWVRLDTNQYQVNQYTGVLTLSQEPSNNQAIAVRYVTKDGQAVGESQIASGELVLKLIKPKLTDGLTPASPSWRLMLKNSYYLGATNFELKDFGIRIVFNKPSGEQIEIVRSADGIRKVISALGLDRVNNSNPADATPDGLLDMSSDNKTSPLINLRTGTLFFPYLEPFGKRVIDYFVQEGLRNSRVKIDSTFYFPDIYTYRPEDIRQNNSPNWSKNVKISIRPKVQGGTSSTLNLNAFNIVDGSVRVSIGGSQLKENVDYRVDYNSGTVTMLKQDLVNTGQISVDYETHDIFTTSTKSVLGFRTEVPVLDRGLFGFSMMNYSMSLPSLKTRQGEEPLSNWIMGVDAAYNVDAPWITDFLNYMPWFNLRDKSSLALRADFAVSLPNPNTQESPMPVDGGASIAYLDDFEGGKHEFPLYSSYGRWSHSSSPAEQSYAPFTGALSRDSLVNELKGKTWWYERIPQDVPIQTIKPNRSTQRAGETAQVLDIEFDPRRAGIYNPTPNQDFVAFPNQQRWGGLMQYAQGLNVAATNTDAIEFWMNIVDPGKNPDAVLKINLGRISEDVIPNGRLDTEDKNGNGRYDPGEDVGLDSIDTEEERNRIPNAANLEDPNNDNYAYTDDNPQGVNNHEGNQNDRSSGLRPDTEDLDANSIVDRENSYYEYDIPLSTLESRYVVGRSSADPNWKQYRIPLSDYARIVGTQDSSFSNISYFRLWFMGATELVHVRMHEMTLVGSQWTRGSRGLSSTNPVGDTSLKISYVNIEENAAPPTNYTEPPGAQRDRLAGQTDYVLGNEQSLAMQLNCVPDSSGREAIRIFQSPNDIFNYRAMAIWVHGDDTREEVILDANNKAWVYIRFGVDEFNYYEYRRPLQRGWQNMRIDFPRLTSLKASKTANADEASEAAGDGTVGSLYRVVGSPTLTNAPYFVLGVENMTGDHCLTTQVWWDELRLLDANDKADYAVNASTQLKLAEFGRITASIVNERPDFHRVDERFNLNRTLNFNWNLTGEFLLQKLLPKSMENVSQFPLTLSHSEIVLRPKYMPNTDVEIESALAKIEERRIAGEISDAEADRLRTEARYNNETIIVKNSIGATGVRFQFPGTFFLIPSFLNRLVYGFGYGEEDARSPQYEYNRSWSWTGTIKYDLPTLPKLSLDPLTWIGNTTILVGPYSQWKMNFLPNRVSFGLSTTRGRQHSLNRLSTLQFPPNSTAEDSTDVLRSRVPDINRVFTATRGMEFQWKFTEGGFLSPSIDYGLDVTSNLAHLEREGRYQRDPRLSDSVLYTQRQIGDILDDIFFTNGALVNPGRDFASSQRIRLSTNPRLPGLFGLEKLVRPLFSYTVDYRWLDAQTNVQNSKIASWQNNITTGLEFNVRELGTMIFGKMEDDAPRRDQRDPRARRVSPDVNSTVEPEEVRRQGYEERDYAPGTPREEPRNTVERDEGFRPQRRRHPIEGGPQLLDTLNRGVRRGGMAAIDTAGRVRIPGIGTGGERTTDYSLDTVLTPRAPIVTREPEYVEEEDPITLKEIVQTVIQKPLFDWNGTRFNFTQTNSSQNPAVYGSGPGVSNFLVKGIFVPEDDNLGPSRAYQLGLITDPHGRLLIRWKPQFPFVEFGVRRGDRAPAAGQQGMNIIDVFNQQNTFSLNTSRPLWEGATISLDWKLQFSYDQRNTLGLDRFGIDSLTYYAKSGDVSRSFLSIPELPFLNISQSGIQKVGQYYVDRMNEIGATNDSLRALVPITERNRIQRESFMQGFESLPFFSGFLREYLPRLNYQFNWTGMEKYWLFSFADRVSFRHGYNGTYRRNYRQNMEDEAQFTTLQTIIYGFRPLIGLDMDWDKVWDGKLRASATYDTQTEWGSDYSSQRITKRLSTQIGVTANFQRQGLNIPFLGLDLKNEFGATFSYTRTISNDSYYTFDDILTNPDGTGNGGLTKTTIEPRVSYTISQQLSIEGFYRYERTEPAATGQLSPPTRLIQAGVDVRLKIQ
jgi:cell surface protein SprA